MFSLWDGGAYTFGLGGLGAGVAAVVDRPTQAPSFAGVARPTLADPILLARPESAPLRALNDAGATLRRRLKA